MEALERAWLAGILEGEGSFGLHKDGRPRISIEMTDRDTIETASRLMGGPSVQVPKLRAASRFQIYRLDLSGPRAAAIMAELAPLMHSRRKARIAEALEVYEKRRRR